ncbi:MAG: protein translocase subunit SecY [bacterium]|nr:MAG: protein translocase subunit SecY [bacterium]
MNLTKRILFTLFVLVIYRIGLNIPLPGIDPAFLRTFKGSIDQFSVFTFGIWPYITVYFILWLLKMVIPSLRKRSVFSDPVMDRYVRYGTIVLCIIQSIGLLILFKNNVINDPANIGSIHGFHPGDFTLSFTLTFILVITSGTLFLVWLADQITKWGVGNGVLLILFAGFAGELLQFKELFTDDKMNRLTPVIILLVFILMIGLVVARQLSARHIPLEESNKERTRITFKIHPINDYLIITIALWPVMFISQLFGLFYFDFLRSIANSLSPGNIVYYLESIILLTLTGYFTYRTIYYNPHGITDQLDKEGKTIPGIASGKARSVYFTKVLSHIALPASIMLAFITVFPDLLMQWTSIPYRIAYLMGGRDMIIMVGAALSVAQSIQRHRKSQAERTA